MSYYTSGRYLQTNARIQQRNLARLYGGGGRSYGASTTGGAPGGLTDAARAAYGQAIGQFAPGGGYMKGIEAGLERGRTKAVAGGMQNLVSAGMSNVTTAAGLGKKYEEEVAAPTRAGATTQRVQALANLQARLGGAEQSAFESGAGRRMSYTQSMMANIPQVQMSQARPSPNPYMRPLIGGNRYGGMREEGPSLA